MNKLAKNALAQGIRMSELESERLVEKNTKVNKREGVSLDE